MEYIIMVFKTILRAVFAYTLPIAFAIGATPSNPSPQYKVGVIQIIEHPALNETCKGIKDELKDQGFNDNLQWSWDSAQGNPALATQIAQKYVGQEVNVLVAIGTTVAQAALNVARTSNTPVVFSSVTNPKAAKLEGNITGVSNFVSPNDQFDAIQQIIPTKKKIGVIYNPGEANSASLLAQMEEVAKAKGLELIPATASKTSEVAIAAQGLVKKVDAIFVNNDNTALAALSSVGQICRENKIPLFASDGDLKESGALALLGADQYKIGRQTGKMVATLLMKKGTPSTITIEFPKSVSVDVNEKVAKELAIKLPESLKKDVKGTT
jgi:putative ABC transport system substrate-binding protein